MKHPEFRAWTGGSPPRDIADCSQGEVELMLALYIEQCETFASYWSDIREGKTRFPSDVANTFWNRARCDAHATYRQLNERR